MKRFLFCVILALLSLGSCSIEEVEYIRTNDYTYNSLEEKIMRVNLNLRLNNPNRFKIKIVKSNLDLFIGGNEAGKVQLEDKVVLKKKTEDDYDMVLLLDSEKLRKAITKAGLTAIFSGKINIRLKGWIKGRVMCVGARVQVDETHNIDIKKLKLP